MAYWRETADGLEVSVRATPKGGRDALDGTVLLSDGREVLKIRVKVAPEDGAATAAVGKVLAKAAGIAPSAVRLVSGATARLKVFHLSGEAERMRTSLADAIGGDGR